MNAHDAVHEFRSVLDMQGAELSSITPEQGLRAMLAFYRDTRAGDCDIASDGDMLLYQWGTYDWGKGPRFELDFTRQFIVGQGEDEDIWQLSLTFAFPPSESLHALGRGDRWCSSPDRLEEYALFISESGVFKALAGRSDAVVELDYESAG